MHVTVLLCMQRPPETVTIRDFLPMWSSGDFLAVSHCRLHRQLYVSRSHKLPTAPAPAVWTPSARTSALVSMPQWASSVRTPCLASAVPCTAQVVPLHESVERRRAKPLNVLLFEWNRREQWDQSQLDFFSGQCHGNTQRHRQPISVRLQPTRPAQNQSIFHQKQQSNRISNQIKVASNQLITNIMEVVLGYHEDCESLKR